ncbi:unnamed protein product [Soboliphyme baturini]|uniref:Uncharacterized protein n=1 Tax=Soboliphyme baturini TaxID=241478 RepID=A0A183I9T9_9BILA|nr:unnamed protein product [Soboliphyme baturini]
MGPVVFACSCIHNSPPQSSSVFPCATQSTYVPVTYQPSFWCFWKMAASLQGWRVAVFGIAARLDDRMVDLIVASRPELVSLLRFSSENVSTKFQGGF